MTTPVADALTTIASTGAPFLAVDVQPDLLTGTFTVDVSEVGGPDLIGWDTAAGTDGWVNVVCDVTAVEVDRGALQQQGLLTRTEAGTATVELRDTERRFDPVNNDDAVHKGTPVRVRAWGYRDGGAGARWDAILFTGRLDAPSVRYQRTGPPLVTLSAVDTVGVLVGWQSEGRPAPGIGAGDTLLQRVQRALTEVNDPTLGISPDSDQLYEATLAPTIMDKPWEVINAAAEAELGRVWVDAVGKLVVRARDSELSGTVRGTLSDVHGEAPLGVHVCIGDSVLTRGPEKVANRVMAARRVPQDPLVSTPPTAVVTRVDDTYSQARYGVAALDKRSLDLQTDQQALQWAQEVALASATPRLRIDGVEPAPWGNPYTSPADPNAWQAVCDTDLGDRWLYRMHPELGPTVQRALGVLGIRHTITPDGWAIEWTTIDAPEPGAINPSGYFTVGLSVVGEDDVLAPFGGQPPASLFGDVDGGGPAQGMITSRLDGGTPNGEQYEAPVDGGGPTP